jgi:hypothetical protein
MATSEAPQIILPKAIKALLSLASGFLASSADPEN